MLLQTVVWAASLIALSAAILGSALVATRAALADAATQKTRLAANDAVAAMTVWARDAVASGGSGADFRSLPAASRTFSESLCPSDRPACGWSATASWNVTGDSAGATPSHDAASVAQNVAEVVGEQRVSVTVNVRVTGADGSEQGSAVREVTVRTFDAAPYAVVTATKDLAAMSGEAAGSEGDSGGAPASVSIAGQAQSTPDPAAPAAYTDTEIRAEVDCANTAGVNQTNPAAAANRANAILDGNVRSGGALQWAYQLPCTPATLPAPPASVRGYVPPVGAEYQAEPSADAITWQKNDRATGSFAP